MTTCKLLGYKVGDKFVKQDNKYGCSDGFEKGDTLFLLHDDGSDIPKFGNEEGHQGWVHVDEVKPIE